MYGMSEIAKYSESFVGSLDCVIAWRLSFLSLNATVDSDEDVSILQPNDGCYFYASERMKPSFSFCTIRCERACLILPDAR